MRPLKTGLGVDYGDELGNERYRFVFRRVDHDGFDSLVFRHEMDDHSFSWLIVGDGRKPFVALHGALNSHPGDQCRHAAPVTICTCRLPATPPICR